MSDVDVLVIGGGLGGTMAALSAADEAPGATVRVVSPREHPFETESGLIDVLGKAPGEADPVADPFEALESLPESHPYRRLGPEALRAGLERFDRTTAGTYAGSQTDRNGLLPTAIGGARPVARYPASVEPGLLSRTDPMALVGFPTLPDLDPDHVAARLRAMDVPFEIDPVTVPLPFDVDPSSPATSIAQTFDENDEVRPNVRYRESAAGAIGAYAGDAERVGLPAVLGLDEAIATHTRMVAGIDADVFEIPLGPPSVLGRRLGRRLREALAEAGVDLERGRDVSGGTIADGVVTAVELEGGETVEPASVVLAPGGLAAGGLRADRTRVRERIFDCHVPQPGDRTEWTAPSLFESHELATLGVDIDADAHPRDSHGEPIARNLYAAGRIVGDHDFVAQGAVGGVALATGYVAGTGAASSS